MRVSSTNSSSRHDHAVAGAVEPQLGERQLAVVLDADATQEGAQAGLQLADVERLDEVVVGARVEAVDAVADGVAGGQDQDRHAVAGVAHAAADLEAVDAGEADVEHDAVGRARSRSRRRRRGRPRRARPRSRRSRARGGWPRGRNGRLRLSASIVTGPILAAQRKENVTSCRRPVQSGLAPDRYYPVWTLTPSHENRHHDPARSAAALFGAASLVTAIGLVLPHVSQVDEGGLVFVSAAAGARRGRPDARPQPHPARVLPVVALTGTVLVSLQPATSTASATAARPAATRCTSSGSCCGRRSTSAAARSRCRSLAILAAYGITLHAIDPGGSAMSRWITLSGLVDRRRDRRAAAERARRGADPRAAREREHRSADRPRRTGGDSRRPTRASSRSISARDARSRCWSPTSTASSRSTTSSATRPATARSSRSPGSCARQVRRSTRRRASGETSSRCCSRRRTTCTPQPWPSGSMRRCTSTRRARAGPERSASASASRPPTVRASTTCCATRTRACTSRSAARCASAPSSTPPPRRPQRSRARRISVLPARARCAAPRRGRRPARSAATGRRSASSASRVGDQRRRRAPRGPRRRAPSTPARRATSTGRPSTSAWNCMRNRFAVAPPSARRISSSPGTASITSATWNAIASSAARAMCARVVPRVMPLIRPRASGSQCGDPSPVERGDEVDAVGRVDVAARAAPSRRRPRTARARRAATGSAAPLARIAPSSAYSGGRPGAVATAVLSRPSGAGPASAPTCASTKLPGAVRRLGLAGVEAALTEERGLLVAGDARDRQRLAEDRALGDHARGRAELGQQRAIDRRRARAARRPTRGARGRAASCGTRCVWSVACIRPSVSFQTSHESTVPKASASVPDGRPREQPLELAGGEVGVGDEARARADQLARQLGAALGRAAVLPDDRAARPVATSGAPTGRSSRAGS